MLTKTQEHHTVVILRVQKLKKCVGTQHCCNFANSGVRKIPRAQYCFHFANPNVRNDPEHDTVVIFMNPDARKGPGARYRCLNPDARKPWSTMLLSSLPIQALEKDPKHDTVVIFANQMHEKGPEHDAVVIFTNPNAHICSLAMVSRRPRKAQGCPGPKIACSIR